MSCEIDTQNNNPLEAHPNIREHDRFGVQVVGRWRSDESSYEHCARAITTNRDRAASDVWQNLLENVQCQNSIADAEIRCARA